MTGLRGKSSAVKLAEQGLPSTAHGRESQDRSGGGGIPPHPEPSTSRCEKEYDIQCFIRDGHFWKGEARYKIRLTEKSTFAGNLRRLGKP